jgi:DNA polymerase-1
MDKTYSNLLSSLKKKPPRGLNDNILLVDGMNMLIRSFSLIKSVNPTGHHVGGLIGFLRSLGYMTRMFDPTRVVVVWDGKGGSGNRKNIDPNYKAQRATSRITHWGLYDSKAEEQQALIGQLYRLQDYLECLPVHHIMMEKLEADDIIAYLAKQGHKNGKRVTIVSSDKDFLQLVNRDIYVYSPIRKVLIGENNILEELKVIPTNYNIVKALLGDHSDNILGIKGLGMKTIIKEFPELVTEGRDLEYIYEVCEKNINKKIIFPKILNQWDKVETNYKLMNLHQTVLDESEKLHILELLTAKVPELRTGPFLHLLTQDRIEGITKNTEGWLQVFSSLTLYNK